MAGLGRDVRGKRMGEAGRVEPFQGGYGGGADETVEQHGDLLVPGGVAVLVGGEGGGGPLGGFERQLLAPLRMLGSGRRFVPLTSSTDPAKLAALAGHLEAGHIRAVIDRRYPLTDTAIAMDHFAAGTVAGKLVLIP